MTIFRSSPPSPRPSRLNAYLPALAWVLGSLALGVALIRGRTNDPSPPAAATHLRPVGLVSTTPSFRMSTPPDHRTTKAIETVAVGDRVLARDERTGHLAAKRVVETYVRTSDHLRILQVRTSPDQVQEFRTTDEHPFWVPGTGWVDAKDLSVGQNILLDDGRQEVVATTRREPHPEGVTVYNFQVEDYHTYFVSQRPGHPGVFVHNAGAGYHHYWPDYLGNPATTKYLGKHYPWSWYDSVEHSNIHTAMNKYFKNNFPELAWGVGYPGVNTTAPMWYRADALFEFYQEHDNGKYLGPFLEQTFDLIDKGKIVW